VVNFGASGGADFAHARVAHRRAEHGLVRPLVKLSRSGNAMALSNLPHRTLTIAWLLAGGLQASACFSSSDAEPSAARQAGILPSRTGTSPGKPTPHDVKLADTSPQDVDNPTWERADAQAQSEENDSAAVDPSVDVDPSVGLDVTSTACGTPDAGRAQRAARRMRAPLLRQF
jgi:hypothetical protein